MRTRLATRYYTFSQATMRRKRVPEPWDATDTSAVAYAQSIMADNVVREDGPTSKPQVRQLWHHTDPNVALNDRYKVIFDLLAAHFPDEPLSKVQAAATDVASWTVR